MVTIVTSIFPRRIEAQQEAVASWLELGFTVVSINVAGEGEPLRDLFHGVTFTSLARQSDGQAGTRVYLTELFAVIRNLPGEVFGIVNSDIIFTAGNSFLPFIREAGRRGMVFGSRIDITVDGQLASPGVPPGYDYFFFTKNILSVYPEIRFCLGKPVWDYWFPLIPLILGHDVSMLATPVAYHRVHEPAWGEVDNSEYWSELQRSLKEVVEIAGRDDAADTDIPRQKWATDFARVRQVLLCQTGTVFYGDAVGNRGGVIVTEELFSRMKRNVLNSIRQCERLAEEKRDVLSSRSWRLTEPLRLMGGFVHRLKATEKKR